MALYNRRPGTGGSFLPEDYIEKKAENRNLAIAVFLFVVVTLGVVGAFFVTNRQWSTVKRRQQEINQEYATETKKIEPKSMYCEKLDESVVCGGIYK